MNKVRNTVILGLSGGPDSVYLLHVLKKQHDAQTINLIAAHLDHEWRTNSNDDVIFCKNACESLNIPFVCAKASMLPITVKPNGSLEEIGRKLRRFFLETTAQEHNAQFIALAHHHDDQLETFFMRLARGASLDGLACIKANDGLYIRPLLDTNKKTILKYLHDNNIPYLNDPTNTSDSFLRNRIRKHIIPALEACDERFKDKITSTIQHLKADNDFLSELTQQAFNTVFTTEDKKLTGSLPSFRNLHPQIQQRLVVQWLIHAKAPFKPSASFIHEICSFLDHERGGSHAIGPNTQVCKKQHLFWIEN